MTQLQTETTDTGINVNITCSECNAKTQVTHPWRQFDRLVMGERIYNIKTDENGNGWIVSTACALCEKEIKYRIKAYLKNKKVDFKVSLI